MKQILNCYANWRIDVIILLGIVALLLASGQSETALTNFIGLLLAVADIVIARRWYKAGKLHELDTLEEQKAMEKAELKDLLKWAEGTFVPSRKND